MQNSTNFYQDSFGTNEKKAKSKDTREDYSRSEEMKNKQKELKKAREFKRSTWE